MSVTLGNNLISGAKTIGNSGAALDLDDGYLFQPNLPAFYAYNKGISPNDISAGFTPFPWNRVRYNNGGHFSTSTGRFTVPISGVYEFHGSSLYRSTSGQGELTFFLNGSASINDRFSYSYIQASGGHQQTHISLMIFLSQGDYIQMGTDSMSTGDFYLEDWLSHFQGKLIG